MRTGTAPMDIGPTDAAIAAGISDRELMGEVRNGDVGRLGELFERHHRRLFSFFLGLTRQRSAAEDLVQEVFVRMLKYRESFKSEAEFTPWMFRLARNAATDVWRARPKEQQHDPESPEPAAELEHPVETLEQDERRRRPDDHDPRRCRAAPRSPGRGRSAAGPTTSVPDRGCGRRRGRGGQREGR